MVFFRLSPSKWSCPKMLDLWMGNLSKALDFGVTPLLAEIYILRLKLPCDHVPDSSSAHHGQGWSYGKKRGIRIILVTIHLGHTYISLWNRLPPRFIVPGATTWGYTSSRPWQKPEIVPVKNIPVVLWLHSTDLHMTTYLHVHIYVTPVYSVTI